MFVAYPRVGLLEQRWRFQVSYRIRQLRVERIGRPAAFVEPSMICFDAVALAGIVMDHGRIL